MSRNLSMGKWYLVYTQTDPMSGTMSIRDEDIKVELKPASEKQLIKQAQELWSKVRKGGFEDPHNPRVIYEIPLTN